MENDATLSAPPLPKKTGARDGCLWFGVIGCLVALLLAAAGGIYMWLNFRKLASDFGRAIIVSQVDALDLPKEQRDGIIQHVNRLSDDYRSGRIEFEQLKAIFQELQPLIGSGVMVGFVTGYVKPSQLSAAEKEAARMTVLRFVQGNIDGKIDSATAEQVLGAIRKPGTKPEEMKFKPKLTDEELRKVLADAKAAADAAGIAAELPVVDLAQELGKAIEQALAKTGKAPASATPK